MWSTLLPVLGGGLLAASTSLVTFWLSGRRQDAVRARESAMQSARERRTELKELMLVVLSAAWNLKLAVTEEWELQFGGTLAEARARSDQRWKDYSIQYPIVELLAPKDLQDAIYEFGGLAGRLSTAVFGHGDGAEGAADVRDPAYRSLYLEYLASYDELVARARDTLADLDSVRSDPL